MQVFTWRKQIYSTVVVLLFSLLIETGTDKCRKQRVTTYPHQILPVALSSTVQMSRSVRAGVWSSDYKLLLLAAKHLWTSHTQTSNRSLCFTGIKVIVCMHYYTPITVKSSSRSGI